MTTIDNLSQPRSYRSPAELLRDLWAILRRGRRIPDLMRGRSLDAAFRERLMLAVTQVNKCRYCAYAHTRMAMSEGVPAEEIEALGRGSFEGVPESERPAVLYAQHWASTNGHPEPAAAEELRALYGNEKAAAIDLSLRVIRIGNLLGNTWDRILGRFGAAKIYPRP